MIKVIKDLLETGKSKIPNLDKKEIMLYTAGLGVLGTFVSEDFFDLPKLPADRFGTDGFFYEIPYFDADQLWCSDNQRMLVVVYHVEKKASYCPLRIDFKLVDKNNFSLMVFDQSGERSVKKELICCEGGQYFSDYGDDYSTLKLSELFKSKEHIRKKG